MEMVREKCRVKGGNVLDLDKILVLSGGNEIFWGLFSRLS